MTSTHARHWALGLSGLLGLSCAALLGAPARAQGAAPAPAPVSLKLQVLSTTDVHGHVYPTNYYGDEGNEPLGLARVATLIKQHRAANPNTLLVDSGDCLQGTPMTYWAARVNPAAPNPMVQAYNHLKYDAFCVGNHEYNYGLDYLNKARREAMYPFLSGNVFQHGTTTPVYVPYVIKQVGGAKVGIVGFTTPGVALWDRRFVQGKQDFHDITTWAKRWVPEVKAKGADAVVVIIHSGLGAPYEPTFGGYDASEGLPEENVCAKLADEVPGIDAILLGHSHKELQKLVRNGVILAQAKKWGEYLAVVDLGLGQDASGKWQVVTKDSRAIGVAGVPPDAELMNVVKPAHLATLNYVNSVVGQSKGEWLATRARTEDTPIMDLVNEVQAKRVNAQLSAASVFNGSARLPKGPLRVKDLASLYVYENTLTKVRISGAGLKAYLENAVSQYQPYQPGALIFDESKQAYNHDMISGVDYVIDVRQPVGQRISGLKHQGRPVTPGMSFTLAINSYRQNGGGGYTMLKQAPLLERVDTEIRELIIEHVKQVRTIDPARSFRRNWHLLPANCVAADGLHYR